MVQYTSAEVAKILKKLNEELNLIIRREDQGKEFLVALGEDVESVRPAYCFHETQRRSDEIEAKIRILKHELNVFNTTTEVPKMGMTVDQVLILIPQLTKRCEKLASMINKLPKTRENVSGFGRNNSVIDYRYLNYDLTQAEASYRECKSRLDCAQLQLDIVNTTVLISFDDYFAGM